MSNATDQGFDFQAPASSVPYLGDHTVVQKIVNEFADRVLAIYHEFAAGEPGGKDAQARIEAMAKDTGDIFMGRKPDEYAPAPWNKPSALGVKLRHAVDSITGNEDPGEAYFNWLSLQMIRAAKSLESGMAEEQVGPAVRVILDDTIARMLGVV